MKKTAIQEFSMSKVGVVLSGSGYLDGAEIGEAVITLLSLSRHGADVVIMAPNVEQMHVVNHLTGQPVEGEKRNVLVEAARIARGKIKDIAEVKGKELDALVFPGGFGAAKNLSDFALKGPEAGVNPEVARLVREVHTDGKWICAVCIAPVVVAKVLQGAGVMNASLTLGTDPQFAEKIQAMGASHVDCPVREFRVDEQNRLISSPAYMFDAGLAEVADGIEQAVTALMQRVGSGVGRR
jgi:enhancing lycopene biosynthesis protein 2